MARRSQVPLAGPISFGSFDRPQSTPKVEDASLEGTNTEVERSAEVAIGCRCTCLIVNQRRASVPAESRAWRRLLSNRFEQLLHSLVFTAGEENGFCHAAESAIQLLQDDDKCTSHTRKPVEIEGINRGTVSLRRNNFTPSNMTEQYFSDPRGTVS
jgi:hypothetical protein